MSTPATQGLLFETEAPAEPGVVAVNDRVVVRTREGHRAVCVDGVVVHHYAVGDRMAEAYAAVLLVDQGYAAQNDVARAFDYAARTLRRYEERFVSGGLAALGRSPGRPPNQRPRGKRNRARDETILRLKSKGASNRAIAKLLQIDEKAVRKRLRRLGWKPSSEQQTLFEDAASSYPPSAKLSVEPPAPPPVASPSEEGGELGVSCDPNPLDRTLDRLLARLGLLDDAAPLFAPASNVPRGGVLLAIPALLASGVLSIARDVYGSIGPAFYGLRTAITVFVLLALLRIKRPEWVKEHAPGDLGRIFGLDRAPEVKTLRRKLALLAAKGGAERFGRELARRHVERRGRAVGFLYVDGHVRVYHGKHTIPKAHVTQMRLSLPATTDYYVNDQRGDPLFVVTAQANAPLTKMLPVVLEEVRALVGSRRRVTVVFDRGGFSPKLFAKLIVAGFDVLTYRKGRFPQIPARRFSVHKARIEGRNVEYRLNDRTVLLLRGALRLRQVTRLSEDGGHQTPILTSRRDLPAAVVAFRMFERWRQENFFKYMCEEFAIDALVDYRIEADDPTRSVPNPAWRVADRNLRAARAEIAKLAQAYGEAAIDNAEAQRPTMRGFKIAHGKIGKELRAARARVSQLERTRAGIPERVPVSGALEGAPVVKLATERKHLTNVLKMVAYQIESDLLGLLRPHYARTEDEGRTLVQTALQSAASIEPSGDELRIVLAPLSAPHRSRAVAALCEALNEMAASFPGTHLRLRYAVAPVVQAAE